MGVADMLSYFLTVVVIAVAPGPVVLMLMVRAASKDVCGAAGFGLGYAIGGVVIIAAVCLGLGTWLTAEPKIFEYSKYVMMVYIIWLARGIWKGGFDMSSGGEAKRGSVVSAVVAGIGTCAISPYMMILFPLVLPGIVDITMLATVDFVAISVATFAALALGAFLVVAFSSQLGRLARSAQSMLIMNRSLASLLVAGGGWMAMA